MAPTPCRCSRRQDQDRRRHQDGPRLQAALAGIEWEEGWDKPLAVWRDELGIKPVTSGDASWYETPDMVA